MASEALIAEYIATGGNEDVSALSDDAVRIKINELLGINPMVTASAVADEPLRLPTPQPKTPATMNDDELLALLSGSGAMEEFAATGAVGEGLKEQQLRDLTDSRNFIENLSDPETSGYVTGRLARQTGASALNTLDLPAQASGLYGLGAMGVEELVGLLNGERDKPNLGSGAALDYANERYLAALGFAGTSEPRNVGESLASIAGMMIPVPGTGKMRAAGEGANMAWNAAEIMTPFIIGGNKAPRMAVNFGTAAVLDQSIRELVDDKDSQYQTAYDLIGAGDMEGLEAFELGTLAAAPTMAIFGGPAAARAFNTTRVASPTIAALSDINRTGPDNLYSVTRNSDVISGYLLSDTDAIMNIARRAGVPDIDELQRQFDTTTQSGASARVTEGMSSGNMPTPHGTFTAPVAPRQLASVFDLFDPQQQIDANNYLLLGNYSDVIKRRQQADQNAMSNWLASGGPKANPPVPKPTMISKPTDMAELTDIASQRDALRTSMPVLNEFSRGVQQLTEAARNFIADGPYALIDQKTKGRFAAEQPHYIPIQISDVDPDEALLARMVDARRDNVSSDTNGWLEARDLSSIDMNTLSMQEGAIPSIINYTQSLLHAQLKNNAKGAYVDAMLKSVPNQEGKPLLRLATKDELKDVKQADRIVDVVRNGKAEHYITESYIARTLQLDPYVLTNPIAMGLYASKRAFEAGTTGAASITFPATSLLRDTLSGWANTTKGQKAPGFGVITAPAEILGAKAMKALYTAIDDRLMAGKQLWLPGMDEQAQRQLSARLATTYQNTFYHMAQKYGGYDASIMKDRIRLAQGQLGEVMKSIPRPVSRTYGVTLKPLLAGMGAILDALLEAPRYNAAKRGTKDVSWSGTVRDSEGIEESLTQARKLTGDTSKSGRSYDNKGRLITGDVVDKKKSIANPLIAGALEFGRVATPYFNPMVKGFQRVVEAAAADPIRFAGRNWLAVGLPATVGYAWNSMLSSDNDDGYDYLDYQFNQRSTDEQVMEMYIGIPGLPPEKGISIPIAHESTPFMAPFLTFLNHMGSGGPEMQQAMTQTGLSILSNAAGIGLPPSMAAFLNLSGVSGVDTLIGGGNSAYQTREDNVGLLPQNIENAIRSQFGTQAAMGLEAISAFADDGSVMAAADEYLNSIAKRMPIVKGLGGWRTNGAYFTPIAAEQRRKLDAYYAFDDAWKTHFDEEGLVMPRNSNAGPMFPDVDANGDIMLEIPRGGMGPQPTMKPVNPLYELYGQQIHDSLAKKDPYGFPATRTQMGALTDQVRLLKGFNAGRADDFRQLQERLKGANGQLDAATGSVEEAQAAYDDLPRGTKTTSPEGRALKAELDLALDEQYEMQEWDNTARFLEANNIDLGNRFDVIRLTNLMEQRRVDLMKYQLSIIEQVENDLTAQLQGQGLMAPDDKFSFEKHLAPMANPMQEAQQPPALEAQQAQ